MKPELCGSSASGFGASSFCAASYVRPGQKDNDAKSITFGIIINLLPFKRFGNLL